MRRQSIHSGLMVFIAVLFGLFFTACQQSLSLHDAEALSIQVDENVVADRDMLRVIQPYKDSLHLTMNEVIGHSEVKMQKGFPEGLLGNFVTDLMLEMTRKNYEADFAFTNNGGLRTFLPKGEVELGTIYELMPFENEIVILELDYQKLGEFFDYIMTKGGVAVSGIKLEYKGKKLVHAWVEGKEIEKDKIYKVVSIDYLANGGDDMTFLKEVERNMIAYRLRDMIIDYVQLQHAENKLLTAKLEGRILIHE
jgi:2',3'-cyclic-nucleotide 2'-phosphodiesterase (5'-nucleotidase family)